MAKDSDGKRKTSGKLIRSVDLQTRGLENMRKSEEMFDDNLFPNQTPPPDHFCNCSKEKKITQKLWCTDCDQWLIDSGVALDHPTDGTFYVCPKCNHRVVLFLKVE